jgi:hypothetical protein
VNGTARRFARRPALQEFVDALARDTVAPAAMGKRGMQAKEAMGVSAYLTAEEELGFEKAGQHYT